MKLLKLNKKRIRHGLGVVMFFGFICLVFQTYFFTIVSVNASKIYEITPIIAFILIYIFYFYTWMPSVFLIIVCYLLLTKVFKYKGEIKKWKKIKTIWMPCSVFVYVVGINGLSERLKIHLNVQNVIVHIGIGHARRKKNEKKNNKIVWK